MTKDQVRAEALALDPKERETLAEELWLSLIDDSDRDEIDAAWLAEVRRREETAQRDRTLGLPVDEVIARVLAS